MDVKAAEDILLENTLPVRTAHADQKLKLKIGQLDLVP